MSAAPYEGAERDPFALTASANDYVPSASIERALADAQAALAEGRVPVISGPTGLGKTLLLQVLARASAESCRALYVPYCSLSPEELASLVLGLLDWSRDDDPELGLLDAARRVAQDGRRLLLLVDDAGSLPGETAAQLAHWLNASGGALQIALAGLPGASLRHARDAFGDRAVEVTLAGGLRTDEVRSYVETRLARAGAEPTIRAAFDATALAELERVSAGNPRRLNLAAQAIVRNAYSADVRSKAGASDASDTAAAQAVASPRADVPTGVGEYRFVRGRFVDPQSGERLATPGPESVWREELSGREREEPRRAAPRQEPEPDIDADLGLDLGSEVDIAAPDALPEDADDSAFAPRLEPPPQAPRQAGSFRWVAAGIAGLAFAVGLWTQMREPSGSEPVREVAPASPSRVVTPTPVKPLPPELSPPEAEAVAPEALATAIEVPAAEAPAIAPEEPAPPELAQEPLAEAPATAGVAPPDAGPGDVPPAQEVESAQTAPAGPVAPESTLAEPAAPPAEMVSIAINATPWAVIEIDGEEVGETPLAGIELTTGRHRFRARMPDGTVRERVVRIDADTPTVVFE